MADSEFPFDFPEDLILVPPPKEPSYNKFASELLYEQILAAQASEQRPLSLLDLPEDLLIAIFVLSAQSDPGSARSLALSCKYIARVTRSARLSNCLVRTAGELTAFKQFVCAEADERDVARFVKHLWLATSAGLEAERQLVPEILAACKNVVSLAAGIRTIGAAVSALGRDYPHSDGVQLTVMDRLTDYPSGKTSFWSYMAHADQTRTVLQNLTHIRFAQAFPNFGVDLAMVLPDLPRLTHIALRAKSMGKVDYHAEIWGFSEMLAPLERQLVAAVLVIRESQAGRRLPPLVELGETARKCGSGIKVLVLGGAWDVKESRLWHKCALEGETLWTLAAAQMHDAAST